MSTPQQIQDALLRVHNQQSFIQELLHNTLGWPIPEQIDDLDEIAFQWTQDDLGAEGLNRHLLEGRVYQIQNLADNTG